jgi:hypothetical protein
MIQWVLAALMFMIPRHLTVSSKLWLCNQKAFTVRHLKENVASMERHSEWEEVETLCASLVFAEYADIFE